MSHVNVRSVPGARLAGRGGEGGEGEVGSPEPEQMPQIDVAVVVETNGIPVWGFRCTAHLRTYFSWDWDVHWGNTGFRPMAM